MDNNRAIQRREEPESDAPAADSPPWWNGSTFLYGYTNIKFYLLFLFNLSLMKKLSH